MPEVSMNVTQFTSSKLKITPDRGIARKDEQPTLRWTPAGGLTIQYIGFAAPVGSGEEIGVPQEDPANLGQWIATNSNQSRNLFSYTVFARTTDGRVISSDPQIENEGTSGGGGMDIEPPGGGGG